MIKRKIRSMFFRQIEMKDIEKEIGLKECVIRRLVRENNWSKARERYLRFLCSYASSHNIQLYKMAELASVKCSILSRIHRKYKTCKYKIKIWNKRITNETEDDFIEEYLSGKSSQEIAEKYGFKNDKTVLDVLRKRNIKRREASKPTFYDKTFFEMIDSHDKAYILGLIMTDGYIVKDYMGFGIQLTKEDGYILEKIAKIVGASQGVSKIKCDAKRRKMPNAKDMIRLTVHNRKISEDLKKLGVVRNKSKILRYNNCVPNEYMCSLFRGLVDGDGCIHVKNNRIQIQLSSSSFGFVSDLKFITEFKLSIHKSSTMYKGVLSTIYNLYVGGGEKERIKFLKWIYKDKNDLYLRRKYEKVQSQII